MTKKRKPDPRLDGDYQRKVGNLVEREVYYCASELIHELMQNPKYIDDLQAVSAQYNEEGDIEREAYEHWIVSDWLADKLEERGEMIVRDFLGLTIWGRCTSGQAILLDGVICDIYDKYRA
jgi:hypothetical protein